MTDQVPPLPNADPPPPDEYLGSQDLEEASYGPGSPEGAERPGCSGMIQRFPVTFALTVVTAAFFLLEWALGGTTDMRSQFRLGALRGDLVWERGEYYRLVGAVFLHHGWFHFIVNWLAFLQLGALIEYVYGSRRLLVFYLLSGLGGSVLSAAFMDAIGGTRGSSGAIFGLAGVTLHLLWRHNDTLQHTMIDTERTRKRLGQCVGFMFVLGIGLAAIGVGVIDNYGHGGGFVTGILCARLTGDPRQPAGAIVTYLARGLVALSLIAFVAIGVHGGNSADAIRELAAIHNGSDRVAAYRAGADPPAGRSVFVADVAAIESTAVLGMLQSELYMQRFDREAAIVTDRWLALTPEDPTALNTRAWLHVTSLDERHQPALALPLVDRALEIAETKSPRIKKAMRAGFLDTRAEALFQLGRHAEALAAQRESVKLMGELTGESSGVGALLFRALNAFTTWRYGERGENDPLPDMRRRLAKIERAARAAGVAAVDSR